METMAPLRYIKMANMLLFLCVALISLQLAGAASQHFGRANILSYVRDTRVNEASGLAASRIHDGILYTLNDHSSHIQENKLYAIQAHTGNLVAVITISGAINGDWEDLSIGPCPDGDSCIYIEDAGLSHGVPPRNTIYRLKEPTQMTDQTVPYIDQLIFRWNEPESECLMVDPVGNVYVVSRVEGGRGLMAKLPSFGWGGAAVDPVVTSRLSINTIHHDPLGCDISPDGKAILIKAKDDIYYYNVVNGDYVQAVTAPARTVSYNMKEVWGESIAWTPKGDGYYTLAEGTYQPLYLYSGTD